MAYVTVNQLKAYLKISGTGGEDALLATFCTRAQGIIDHLTGTSWESTTATLRRFDAMEPHVYDRELFFGGLWAAQIVSVINGDGVSIPASAYVTEPRGAELGCFAIALKTGSAYRWTWSGESPEEAIQIIAHWGRTMTAPEFIAAAALRLAAFLYRQKDSGADVDRAVTTGDGVTLLPQALPRDVRELLAPVASRGG